MPKRTRPIHGDAEELRAYIEQHSMRDGDHRLWTGVLDGAGKLPILRYYRETSPLSVRRLVWEMHHGSAPGGHLVIVTTCGEPLCVRAEHLAAAPRQSPASQPAGVHAQKLTPRDVRAIRALAATGEWGPADLAPMFGVTPGAISHITTRRFWKYVDEE